MAITPQLGDSENDLIAKIAINTGPNLPTRGDGRWNLLWKVVSNTYASAVNPPVLPGGTTNQVLAKRSNADNDVEWKTLNGGAQYLDGEANTFNDLPVTIGDPALDAAYLVKEASGVWLINRKPAGIYIRTSELGSLSDWTYAGILPDVFSGTNFAIYKGGDSSAQFKFDVTNLSTATTRVLVVPNADGTIKLSEEIRSDFVTDTSYIGLAPIGSLESDEVWTIYKIVVDSDGNVTSTEVANNVSWDDRYTATYSPL